MVMVDTSYLLIGADGLPSNLSAFEAGGVNYATALIRERVQQGRDVALLVLRNRVRMHWLPVAVLANCQLGR